MLFANVHWNDGLKKLQSRNNEACYLKNTNFKKDPPGHGTNITLSVLVVVLLARFKTVFVCLGMQARCQGLQPTVSVANVPLGLSIMLQTKNGSEVFFLQALFCSFHDTNLLDKPASAVEKKIILLIVLLVDLLLDSCIKLYPDTFQVLEKCTSTLIYISTEPVLEIFEHGLINFHESLSFLSWGHNHHPTHHPLFHLIPAPQSPSHYRTKWHPYLQY